MTSTGTGLPQAFLDSLSDAVLVLDGAARVKFANTAALRVLPCDVGTPVRQLAPRFGAGLVAWVDDVLAGRRSPDSLPEGMTPGAQAPSLQPLEHGLWALRLPSRAPAARVTPPAPAITGMTAELEQVYRMFWSSPFPVTLQDESFRMVEVNDAYVEFCGLPREHLTGLDPVLLQPEEDRPGVLADRERILSDVDTRDLPQLVERRLIDGQGRERWFRAARRLLHDAQGRRFYLAVLQDCTAEHVAREQADRSVHELEHWFELSPIGMVLFDDSGLVVRTNTGFEALVGGVPVLLSEASPAVQQLLCWAKDGPLAQMQPGSPPVESQGWVPSADGSLRRLRGLVRCYEMRGDQRRYMCVVEDLSAEEERDLAKLQLGTLADTAGAGLATFQEAGLGERRARSTAGPQGQAAQQGANAEASSAGLQAIGRDVVLPESMPEFERVQQALKRGERAEARYAIRHPDHGTRWLVTRVEPGRLASGQRTTSVVTLDVTEQQQAQARSEQLLRELSTILESSPAGIAYLRGNTLVRCNRRFERMLGFTSGAIAGCSINEMFAQQPAAKRVVAESDIALAEAGVYETEIEMSLKGRPAQWYALSVRRMASAGGVPEAIAVLSDITRLKSQQTELEALARDRELMFSLSDVGIAFVRHGTIQRANEALADLTGLPAERLAGLAWTSLFADSQGSAALPNGGRWSGERQLRHGDGGLLWVQVSQRLVDDADPEAGLIASYVNIDARRRAEQAVALQAERTRAILDSVFVGIVTVGGQGIEWMNRSARRMFGGDLADFVGQPIGTVATPDAGHPFNQTQLLDELAEGQAYNFECRVKARDGREFWVVGNAVSTLGDSGAPQLTYALLDIERRRQAEAHIAEAQASLQRIIELAPLAITLRDAKTLRVLQLNQVAAATTVHDQRDAVGHTPEELYEPQQALRMRADMESALRSSQVTQREYRIERDGRAQFWDARYLPLAKPGEPPDQLLLVATEVTEQRMAQEARLEAAIAQREMLVQEVHHRIKNNLQGVAGLLQQIAAKKPEVASAIAEVVGQVQAIAQVYGLQVGSGGPLLLKSVVEAIAASVQRTFGRNIELAMPGEPAPLWGLPEAESIPIALTLNELLTNAIKHSHDTAGAIGCTLLAHDGGVCIEISNPGRLPEGFSLDRFPGGVSGLGLIRALLPRRSAKLALETRGDRVVAAVNLVPPGVSKLTSV